VDHRARGLEEAWFADVVARFLLLNDTVDVSAQLLIGSACAKTSVKVMLALREETGANFSVRREADSAACSAEGLRNRCDDADLTAGIGEAVAPRSFTGVARGQLAVARPFAASRGGLLQAA